MSYIFLKDKIINKKTAKISPFINAFLFGEGLFETLRAENGKPDFLKEHLKRLSESVKFFNWKIPNLNYEKIITDLIKKNCLLNKKAKVKIIAFNDVKISIIITTEQYKPLNAKIYQKGVKVGIAPAIYNSPWAGFKSISRFYYMHLHKQALKNKLFSYILSNNNGSFLEAVNSNIIIYKNSNFFIPGYSKNRLKGTIEKIIEKNTKIKYINIKKQTLKNANLFLTNSLIKAVPVNSIVIENKTIKIPIDLSIHKKLMGFLNDN